MREPRLQRLSFLSGNSGRRDNCEMQNSFDLASLVGKTQKVERTGVHCGEVFAIFIRTGRSRNDNDGYFWGLPPCEFYQFFVGAIFETKTAKTGSDIRSDEELVRGCDPVHALNLERIFAENLRETRSRFPVVRGNHDGRRPARYGNARNRRS